jgi:2-polyprenyl-6-methoxyphenol hydroxylase-like FAD-dependent oxidoreductase
MLVAAGGHFCPVGRLLALADRPGGGQTPFFKDPSGGPLIVSQEIELELSPEQQARLPIDPEVPEVYFCRDLLGYGWCIRKGNYLNIGLGRADRRQLPRHVADFCQYLQTQNRIPPDLPHGFVGHAYLLYQQSARPLVADGTLWIGDSAGLAYPQSGEGIRPAVESGLMAAEAILAAGGDYRPAALEPYRRRVEARFGRRPKRPPVEEPPSALRRLAARWLLARPWFVRRVLLERWFLHCSVPPLSACGYNAEVRS